jgi:Rieske Fe-S protein
VKINESCLARRRFLCSMLGSGAAALGAGAALPLIQYTGNFRQEPPPDFLALEESECELAPGTAKMVMYGRIPAMLLKSKDAPSELRIFVATCTHLNCTVHYVAEKDCIFCACHEGYYDNRGQVVSGPPPEPLRPFYSKRQKGKLVIALEKENLEKAS